jgi:hypothetical protein
MVFAGLLTLPGAGPVGGLAALLADQGVLGVIALPVDSLARLCLAWPRRPARALWDLLDRSAAH